ncbi:hypothetical protein AMATHDRAFT_87454 [Amanita thiersii Skay4041]|uniref:Uncharacterized protein n=1 Tax=Amanita thiersii Skay4041 TaxID=703135 RepID=A0A2A9NHX5_9AGAR|nr:hypothetical protein AMATHDRAFT_87454 [Amanita thiersii Skay4041]
MGRSDKKTPQGLGTRRYLPGCISDLRLPGRGLVCRQNKPQQDGEDSHDCRSFPKPCRSFGRRRRWGPPSQLSAPLPLVWVSSASCRLVIHIHVHVHIFHVRLAFCSRRLALIF